MGKDTPSFAAVIAAAGLSSRMGQFKPLLPFGKSTIIGSVISAFKDAGADEIIVVCGHNGEELGCYVMEMNARAVFNTEYAKTGMFESLKIGIENLQTTPDRVFLTPGDIPAISKDLILTMLKRKSSWAVPICNGKRAHPVMLTADLLPAVLSSQGNDGLRGVLNSMADGAEISWDEEAILIDADTPEDYQRLLSK